MDDTRRVAMIDRHTIDNGITLSTPVVSIRYQYDNHLGSASLELDQNAAIISYEEYHPFGTTSYRSGRTETEVAMKRYKYVGKERDEETGLYYYGARYYAAWIARFVSVDPLQLKYPYYTPYQYAGNKPVSYIDLDGLEEAKTTEEKKPEEKPGNWNTDGLSNKPAFKLFEATEIVQNFKKKFAEGEFQNYEIRFVENWEIIKPADGLTAINIVNPNKKPIFYPNVTGKDITKDTKVQIIITVDDSLTVDDARTLGHELFLHVVEQLSKIHKILNSKASPENKAKRIAQVYKDGNIYNPADGKLVGYAGDADHAKILNKSNKSYLTYLKQLGYVIKKSDATDLKKSIKGEYERYNEEAWLRWKAKVGEYCAE